MGEVEQVRMMNIINDRDRLRKALEPFANIALAQDGDKRAPDMIDGPDLSITPEHVRAARRALGEPC